MLRREMNVNEFIDAEVCAGIRKKKYEKAYDDKHFVVDELRNVERRVIEIRQIAYEREDNARDRYEAGEKSQQETPADNEKRPFKK